MNRASLILQSVTDRLNARKLPLRLERIVVAFSLALYAALLIYLIPRHAPWADEAQAWELAASLSLKSLFGTYIHYECSPGLWHFLLWLLDRLHVTYYGMRWFVAVVALVSMVILVLKAPFPLAVRILLPFTFFFAFQYAVVARSYVLIPAILFALASIWPARRKHPIALSFLLGLLANVTLHGSAVAMALGLVLAIEWYSIQSLEQQHWRRWLASAALFAGMLGFALWCLVPAPDAGWWVLARKMPYSIATGGGGNHHWIKTLPFYVKVVLSTWIRFVYVLRYGLTSNLSLGIMAWVLLVWRLGRQHRLRYILPAIFPGIVCMYSYYNFYHAGLLWAIFLFVWWVTWPANKTEFWKENLIEISLLLAVVLCIANQLVWTVNAVRWGASMPYSASQDGATIVQRYLMQGNRVDIAVPDKAEDEESLPYFITGVEPYFMTEPINNKIHRFWFWGGDDDVRARYLADSDHHAAVVVVEETAGDHGAEIEERRLEALGYKRANSVCGQTYYPDQSAPVICEAFYQPFGSQGHNQ